MRNDVKSIDEMPILSVRTNLSSNSEIENFVVTMYNAYNLIEDKLKENSYVDISTIKCCGCKYGLTLQELTRNMYRVRDKYKQGEIQ